MKLQSAINKAAKAAKSEPTKNGMFYTFEFNNQLLQFSKNGRYEEITCISTRKKGQEDDVMTDYFCGTYHDNLSKALKFIGAL
jgi:hypothetical protein